MITDTLMTAEQPQGSPTQMGAGLPPPAAAEPEPVPPPCGHPLRATAPLQTPPEARLSPQRRVALGVHRSPGAALPWGNPARQAGLESCQPLCARGCEQLRDLLTLPSVRGTTENELSDSTRPIIVKTTILSVVSSQAITNITLSVRHILVSKC